MGDGWKRARDAARASRERPMTEQSELERVLAICDKGAIEMRRSADTIECEMGSDTGYNRTLIAGNRAIADGFAHAARLLREMARDFDFVCELNERSSTTKEERKRLDAAREKWRLPDGV